MSSSFPSIQTFYQREFPSSNVPGERPKSRPSGDGFTLYELETALDPRWVPQRSYKQRPISLLDGGPHDYEITGRIVNFSSRIPGGKHSDCVDGQYFLVVSDGTGALAVKIFCPMAGSHHPSLGQRVTIWTTYIADSTAARVGSIPFVNRATTLYPSRNSATHIRFHRDECGSTADQVLRIPLGLDKGRDSFIQGLMNLRTFISGGYDIGKDAKILVSVRSIGPRKTTRSRKHEGIVELVEVGIFDETATSALTLWNDMTLSSQCWIPNHTVLLISAPTCKILDRPRDQITAEIGIGYSSMVEVDPDLQEVRSLRQKVSDMAKSGSVHIPFPQDIWDINAVVDNSSRQFLTIAEIDERVRQYPKANFIGKVNVIITEMYLLENWRGGTTCCLDCCGVPLYAKRPVATCKRCGQMRQLCPNSRIVGSLVDESGLIHGSKLVWSDQAWTQLFFGNPGSTSETDPYEAGYTGIDLADPSWEDLLLLDSVSLRDFEDQILYARLIVTMGWCAELQRMCILGVEWCPTAVT